MSSAPERGTRPTQPLLGLTHRFRPAVLSGAFFKAFSTVSAAAWVRMGVLFALLASIKIALVLQLAPHLFQVHWRVAGNELTMSGRVAFSGFILLAVAHLRFLARDCSAVGIKALRMANGSMLAIAFIFILLTFHTGERNYLFPILTGILKWSSLGPYLSLDFFFRPPYLALWIFIYTFSYYVLARTKREHWSLHLTALFGGIYGALHLRELALYREELLVIDALGAISLMLLWRQPKSLPLAAIAAPLAWTLFFSGLLLYEFGPRPDMSFLYFAGLLGGSLLGFTLVTYLLEKAGVGSSWRYQILFFFAAFVLLTNNHYAVAQNFNQALWLGLVFPRYFLGEMAICLGLLAIAAACHRVLPRLGLLWLDFASLLAMAITLIDFRLTAVLGVRLDWNVLALGNSPKMMWRMAKPYLPVVLLAVCLLALFYYGVVWLVVTFNQRNPRGLALKASPAAFHYLAATFVVLALLGAWTSTPDKGLGHATVRLAESSPLWKRISGRIPSPERFFETAKALGVTFDTGIVATPELPPRDLNVVLVFMESTYNQHLSLFSGVEDTQPLLSQYKDRMEIFPNFFSSFASSIHARFATFTSLYPVSDYNLFTADRVAVKSLFEVLHDQGYSCSMFYSSFADFTGFRDFLKNRGLAEMYDADTMPGRRMTERVSWGLREEETLEAMRARIQKYAADHQRFFLTYVPAAPHYPYEGIPPQFRKFQPAGPGDYTALYLDELLYMDWVLASLIDQLKTSGLLEKTLIVITDDHGEMLGGKGDPIGHGWLLTPELANAPLIIMDPEKPAYQINRVVGSQVDLLPTLLHRLRIPLPAGQLYQGRSLDAPTADSSRIAYLNSYQQYGLITGGRLIFGDREKKGAASGTGTTYSISNNAARTTFLAEEKPGRLPVSILKFEQFQKALLRNYSAYARANSATPQRTPPAADQVARHQ